MMSPLLLDTWQTCLRHQKEEEPLQRKNKEVMKEDDAKKASVKKKIQKRWRKEEERTKSNGIEKEMIIQTFAENCRLKRH